MSETTRLKLIRPDDWHVHLRDGDVMNAVLPYTAQFFGRAIIMPNLVPPVTSSATAMAYRERIIQALPKGADFKPLMTCYLTDTTDEADLIAGFEAGIFTAAKLYPAGATTNSDSGVTQVSKIYRTLAAMEQAGMPLLVHGEMVDPEVDIFDREAVFIERVLDTIRSKYRGLKIVFEHITTQQAADYVMSADENLGATITPHHLLINRNALFVGGIRPHMYCLPIVKRERHRLALVKAATSGDNRFFLGADSAPLTRSTIQTDCGCAGIFNAPTTLPYLAGLFEAESALNKLAAFVSLNGCAYYGLEPNESHIVLEKFSNDQADAISEAVPVANTNEEILVFQIEGGTPWRVVEN